MYTQASGNGGRLIVRRRYSLLLWETISCVGEPNGFSEHDSRLATLSEHKGCNVPSVDSIFGKQVREIYCCGDRGYQVGIDLSGIEARMMCHFAYPFTGGKEFAELVLEGDWHTVNATMWGVSRGLAKRILYALMYGAGAEKLGSIIGKPKSHGQKLKDIFFENTTALAELIASLERQLATKKYLNTLDGRKFFCRSKKDVLNTTLQGNSAIIFKNWMINCHDWLEEKGLSGVVHKMAAVHDEIQLHVDSEDEDLAHDVGEMCCRLATKTGLDFNLNVKIDAACKVGFNWNHCH